MNRQKNIPHRAALLVALLLPALPGWAADLFAADGASPALLNNGRETVSLISATMKAFGALALIIGLMLLVTLWLRKMGLNKGAIGGNALINVLDTKMIAPKKQIAVIEVGGDCVVVGITDQQINLLTKLENSGEILARQGRERGSGHPLAASFSNLLDKAVQRGTKPPRREQ